MFIGDVHRRRSSATFIGLLLTRALALSATENGKQTKIQWYYRLLGLELATFRRLGRWSHQLNYNTGVQGDTRTEHKIKVLYRTTSWKRV